MKISIVTAVYNAESTIADTIESVINGGIDDYEHIIVDGLSTDRTLEIVRSYNDPKIIIISEADTGIYDAMNKGIRAAQGILVATLNADDYYLEGALMKISEALENHPEADIIHGNLVYEKKGKTKIHYPAITNYNYTGLNMPSLHPSTFIRKSVYEAHGYYDHSYKIAADYDYLLGLYRLGKIFHHVDYEITHMRWGGESIKRWRLQHEEEKKIHLKHKLPTYLRWQFKFNCLKARCRFLIKQLLISEK